MNRYLAKSFKIIFKSRSNPAVQLLPRCFSNQEKNLTELDGNKKEKKAGPVIFTMQDALKFKMQYKEDFKQPYFVEGYPNGHELVPHMKIGTRIRRGRDWMWEGQGGHKPEGEIIEGINRNGWVRVQWDYGQINSYRMGTHDKFDLQLAPPGSCRPVDNPNCEFEEEISEGDLNAFDSNLLESFLLSYYKQLFPHRLMVKWLSYNIRTNYFCFREFCFTMLNKKFLRYKSFENAEDLKKALEIKCPLSIHIGSVFTERPKLKKKKDILTPWERELVFDIDISSYNNVRNCCTNNQICKKCWKLMIIAVKIMERSLKEDFGFKNILWVFSGRRGIHCWVCDDKARALSNEERKKLMTFFLLKNDSKKMFDQNDTFHQHVQKSADIGLKYFEELCVEQDLLCNKDSWSKIMFSLPDANTRCDVAVLSLQHKTSIEKWRAMTQYFSEQNKVSHSYTKDLSITKKIILDNVYPRLDEHVSLTVTHLLKAPFSVHSTTGCVCVPFSQCDVESFNPSKVPHICQLEEEIYQYDLTNRENYIPHYKKTSLKKYVEYFEEFLSTLNKDIVTNTEERTDGP